MIKQICILTKSYKHGGYCVAGIDMQTRQWIRLVNSEDPNTDEIKREQMLSGYKRIDCLDVVEYDFIKQVPNNCQVENWLLNKMFKPKFIRTVTIHELLNLAVIEKDDFFILNKAHALNSDEITGIKRSLFCFNVQKLQIEATTYESYGEIRSKYKCSFQYNGHHYSNISLTDPIYRDLSQDGSSLTNALIIASLPAIPHSDNLYYKFVAKIIPLEDQTALYPESENWESESVEDVDNNATANSPFTKSHLVIQAQQTPGVVLFANYEQLKQTISSGVAYYSKFDYSLENYHIALRHHEELKHVKTVLEGAKRELVKSYNAPLEVVERRLAELIELVKVPYKRVDAFIKDNEKNAKKYEIYSFSKELAIANGLQEHMDYIFKSPAYFNLKWLNVSCSATAWKGEVTDKIKSASTDIAQILSMKGCDTASVLAHYYQTLSMEQVEEFLSSLKAASEIAEKNNSKNCEADTGRSDDANSLQDYEILNCVAGSVNPYTGEVITGVDDCLKTRLNAISVKLQKM